METKPETKEICGPSCACERPPAHTKLKAVICFVVLAAVAAILIFKLAACSTRSAPGATEVNPAQTIQSIGEPLASFSDLSTVAAAKDTVFVVIPTPGNAGVKQEVAQSINQAKQKLEAKGVSIGLYTLKVDSPDYSRAAAQPSLPGVLVMSKGRGKEMVTGEITESRLLQAYVASSRASGSGGCACSKGGGSSTCGSGQ